jgi:hypothetical protein
MRRRSQRRAGFKKITSVSEQWEGSNRHLLSDRTNNSSAPCVFGGSASGMQALDLKCNKAAQCNPLRSA